MAISLRDLKKVRSTDPPRTLIYGPPGLGKTSLAGEFPDTVFIQIEEGTPADLELTSFGVLNSYAEVMEAIGALYTEDHGYRNVAIDTLDRLEPLVWAAVCEANNWKNIEEPGYGKGYVTAESYWRDMLDGLAALRREKGMSYTLIAHSEIGTFNDPRTASYSRYDIRLQKRAVDVITGEVDLICFLNQEATIKEEKLGFNKTRTHAEGGIQRIIYLENRPSLNAKNRYGMPPRIPYKKGEGYTALARYFPHVNGGVAPVEEQPEQPAEQTTKPKNSKKAA